MTKPIATNKKAYRDYFFLETYECGIALQGGEVKSIRDGHVNFKDSFARVDKEEVFLYNLHVDPYPQASYMNDVPDRVRKLLLNRKEIKKVMGKIAQKGLALIPTKIYFNSKGFVKVELALSKGKKQYDKRDTIKKREVDRDLSRAIRNRR
jgi:SsrA-binding protein